VSGFRSLGGSGNYRRIPTDAEGYRKIPKATESRLENYSPSVSGVVANLELGERLGVWG